MRVFPGLLIALFLAACGRPLTPAETAFARNFLGPDIVTRSVRFSDGLAPERPRTIPARPRTTCQERIWPPSDAPSFEVTSGAMTIFQTVHYRGDLYLEDYLTGLPEAFSLPAAMLFAHEMVHVWQWQNRIVTGYHPLRAAFEHVASADPYLFDTEEERDFLSFGYEQQGSIMEEYLCCRTLAPEAPRTARLDRMLRQYFDLPPLDRPLAASVWLPWEGVETGGICD